MKNFKEFEVKKVLQVSCPKCRSLFVYHESEFRPFCSKRCKMIDLGHWMSESYSVPGKEIDNTCELEEDDCAQKQTNENDEED